jgi:hypothetical protein
MGQVFGDPRPADIPQPPPPGPRSMLENKLLIEMLREGYKRCAMKYHPDQGGDPEKMLELNRIKQELGF